MEKELTNIFNERKINEQLIFENDSVNEMRIIWRRKRVDAFVQDGKLEAVRTMVFGLKLIFKLFKGVRKCFHFGFGW